MDNKQVYLLLCNIADCYEEKKKELSSYDAVIGDGDHGFSLARGNMVAKEKIINMENKDDISNLFKTYGRELTCEIGGAMGPLFGLLFTQIGKVTVNKKTIELEDIYNGLSLALTSICELGGAKLGDKTMVDAIVPTVKSLEISVNEKKSLKDGMKEALICAENGVKSTINLQAKRGRSKYLREKSIGHQDAGATSFYYFIKTISDFVNQGE